MIDSKPPKKQEKFDVGKFIQDAENNLLAAASKVLSMLRKEMPGCKIYSLGTFVRANWYLVIQNLLPKLNAELRKWEKIKITQIGAYMLPKNLDDDLIHFLNGIKCGCQKG